MIEWINFVVLVASTLLFLFFYIKSVGPAALEKKIGETAYPKCKRYRILSGAFEGITIINYIIYYFYPLPLPLQQFLLRDWWISALIGIAILLPSFILMVLGLKDAGEESLEPKKEHALYGGIYERIRHPQAVGEMLLWFPVAFFLNSLFLVLFSFIWIPIFYIMCIAEERDLIIRYGQPYLDYRERVGFWLPKPTKLNTEK